METTLNDQTNGKLIETLRFARKIKDPSLRDCLTRLKAVDENCGTKTTIWNDFAPKSFEFSRMKDGKFAGNGGIIFHGSHDGNGSGSAPTFSVSLTPAKGWQIHT